MPSIHSPERQQGETQKDYRERMAKAKGVAFMVRRVRNPGHNPQRNAQRKQRRAAQRARVSAAQSPKFPKARRHKDGNHCFHDAHGAYVCVGPEYEVEGVPPDTDREHVTSSWVHGDDMGYTARRKWLAGVSERRGF